MDTGMGNLLDTLSKLCTSVNYLDYYMRSWYKFRSTVRKTVKIWIPSFQPRSVKMRLLMLLVCHKNNHDQEESSWRSYSTCSAS